MPVKIGHYICELSSTKQIGVKLELYTLPNNP